MGEPRVRVSSQRCGTCGSIPMPMTMGAIIEARKELTDAREYIARLEVALRSLIADVDEHNRGQMAGLSCNSIAVLQDYEDLVERQR